MSSSGGGGGFIDNLTNMFKPKAHVTATVHQDAAPPDPADTARAEQLATEGRIFRTSGVLAGGTGGGAAMDGGPPSTSRQLYGSTGMGGLT